MSTALVPPPTTDDESWRLAGCSVRCRVYRVTFSGRRFAEPVAVHDPATHEAYGEAILLRRYSLIAGRVIRTGSLVIDGFNGTFRVDGEPIHLTSTEARIIGFLATHLGALCHPEAIARAVWGHDYLLGTDAKQRYHPLTMHVHRIRRKLGSARPLLVTVTDRGYRLDDVEATP